MCCRQEDATDSQANPRRLARALMASKMTGGIRMVMAMSSMVNQSFQCALDVSSNRE